MAYMIVKHLVMGWTRRVMASACTDFLCRLVWRLLMCLFVQHNKEVEVSVIWF